MSDPFGLQRELKINKSGVRQVFTPHQPIQSLDLFFGRQAEVRSIIEHLNTPGQHALLFGDRGVGKSSLANVASTLLLKNVVRGKLHRWRCDSTDNFVTIVAPLLHEMGIDIDLIDRQTTTHTEMSADLRLPILGAGANTSGSESVKERDARERARSPAWVAEKLRDLSGLLLVDEVDALAESKDRHLLAELVKQLSDGGGKLKIFLVGISDTGADLVAGHPSVQRCLKETRLRRMGEDELREIIDGGEKRLNLKFTNQAKTRIVKVSSGYAHFTHLLALKAAEDAIAEDRKEITVSNVESATRRAVDDAEGSLRRVYGRAARSHATEEYRKILCAAASCGADEFTARELRDSYGKLWGNVISQSAINNYFQRLVSDGNDSILRRLAKGVYRFNDPRMPSFVRIANPECQFFGG